MKEAFIEWVIEKIASEQSGPVRLQHAAALADLTGQKRLDVLKSVEDKTKAKDKGRMLALLDSLA